MAAVEPVGHLPDVGCGSLLALRLCDLSHQLLKPDSACLNLPEPIKVLEELVIDTGLRDDELHEKSPESFLRLAELFLRKRGLLFLLGQAVETAWPLGARELRRTLRSGLVSKKVRNHTVDVSACLAWQIGRLAPRREPEHGIGNDGSARHLHRGARRGLLQTEAEFRGRQTVQHGSGDYLARLVQLRSWPTRTHTIVCRLPPMPERNVRLIDCLISLVPRTHDTLHLRSPLARRADACSSAQTVCGTTVPCGCPKRSARSNRERSPAAASAGGPA